MHSYKQSFLVVILALVTMGVLTAGAQVVSKIPGINGLPSSYDPKIRVENAVKTAGKPLLIEFYTDSCGTCRVVTPWVHDLKGKYKNDVQLVMVDVNDPSQNQIAQIFNIQYIPAIFVFDFKHMTKAQVSTRAYYNKDSLDRGIGRTIAKVKQQAAAKQTRKALAKPPKLPA